MSDTSSIEWTDATWNPVRGCTKVSPGCANCYAETFAERWRGVKGHAYEQGFDLRLVPEKLAEPLRWRAGVKEDCQSCMGSGSKNDAISCGRCAGTGYTVRPKRIFTNSMSDLFQDGVPDEFIDRVFAVMALAPQHTFQVLTKRADRMRDYVTHASSADARQRRITALEVVLDGDAIQRGLRSRAGAIGRVGDRLRGPSLAGQAEASKQLGKDVHAGGVQADQGRDAERALSPGEGDEGRRSEVRGGSQAGVVSLQGSDSSGLDGQSQVRERGQDGQQAVEFGAGDQSRANGARVHGLRAEESRAGGRVEQAHASYRGECALDQGTLRSRLPASEDRRELRHQPGCGVSDRLSALLETHHVVADWLAGNILPNVRLGVSCENQHFADERIPLLLQTPAAVRFISAEPLLEEITIFSIDGPIDLRDQQQSPLDWVIVGGESGPGARRFDIAWARSIVAQCKAASVPVFVKQFGAVPTNAILGPVNPVNLRTVGAIKDRKGGDMAEWPEDLRIREFPAVRA